MWFEPLILFIIVLYLLYNWGVSNYDFFEKRNIPFEKPFPFLGNLSGMFFKTEHLHNILQRLHAKFNSKIYGLFESRTPLIVIKDIELIKQITVRDFDHFVNHRNIIDPEDEVLFGNSLIALKDDKWRNMRAVLSPAFTGSKIRQMFEFISDTSAEAIKYLEQQSKSHTDDGIDLDIKEFFTRYTNDVIASCAFGININSLADKDNEFYKMVKKSLYVTGWTVLKLFLYNLCKPIMKVTITNEKFKNYFMHLVLDSMKYRTVNKIVRPDMINLLMQTNTENAIGEWSDVEKVAQCYLFYLAGYETTAVMMCFAAIEIMNNPEVQLKLLAEIDDAKEKWGEKALSYDSLKGMKYMDMVMSETLRKWPPAPATDRVCAKPYTLRYDDTVLNINVGDIVWFNLVGMHYNPEYFPNPCKFDPERFNDENRHNITPFTFGPFGFGPRNCIGSRLALLEAKAILFQILSKFTFGASPRTCVPLQIDNKCVPLQPKNGFWLKLTPRI